MNKRGVQTHVLQEEHNITNLNEHNSKKKALGCFPATRPYSLRFLPTLAHIRGSRASRGVGWQMMDEERDGISQLSIVVTKYLR